MSQRCSPVLRASAPLHIQWLEASTHKAHLTNQVFLSALNTPLWATDPPLQSAREGGLSRSPAHASPFGSSRWEHLSPQWLEPRWISQLGQVEPKGAMFLFVWVWGVLDDTAAKERWWQQYTVEKLEAWRSGNWSGWTCTNCQTVGWSEQKKWRHCGVKRSYASALPTTTVHSWDGHNRKPQVSTTTTSGGTTAIFVWQRSSTNRSKFGRALCRCIWVRKLSAAVCLNMDVPAMEATRKLLEQKITELRTQEGAPTPLSKRLESARRAPQRAQRRAEEAKVAFTLAQTVKAHAGQEAARMQSEICTLEQEAHKAGTEATGARPLDCCSDTIAVGAPVEHLEQAPQAAFTLINGLQRLCTVAGEVTVADEEEDQMIDFDGSDEEFRQIPSGAPEDEESAKSVRIRLTYTRSQTGEENSTITNSGDLSLAGHVTPCE